MANILFIAYDYPPILSPEAIQVQRRTLALAQNGHKVYVITAHLKPEFEFIDNTLVLEHENIQIIKTKKPLFEKSLNVFFSLVDITDRKFWWQYFAFDAAKKIIEEKNIDIIYTHSTPLVDHFVGLKLKSNFKNIKWIAHFSDPWSLNPYKTHRFIWQKKLNKKFERIILQATDTITVTSERTKMLFCREFSYVKEKIFILPHTFDKSLLQTIHVYHDKKIVVHTGNIYGLRTIKYFLKALKIAKPENIEFHFYGKIREDELKLVKILELEDIVKCYKQVPYFESLEIIAKADYLMIIDAALDDSPFFPSKLADYIGAEKPIIALTPSNSTTVDILKHVNNTDYIANSDSIEEIKELLQNLRLVHYEPKNIEEYSMENFTLIKEIFFNEK